MTDTNIYARSSSSRAAAPAPPEVAQRSKLLVIDDDEGVRRLVVDALRRRYGMDYEVIAPPDPGAALAELAHLRDAGEQVALIAARESMTAGSGSEFLGATRELFPTARRVALARWGDGRVLQSISRASTLGQIDHFAFLPWGAADEQFLATIGDVLADWASERGRVGPRLTIVGQGDAESQLISDVLQRWGAPLEMVDAGSDAAKRILSGRGGTDQLPMLVLPDGRELPGATIAEVSTAFGADIGTMTSPYDVAVLGLGPAGLSATVNAAAEGLRVLMIESSFSQASSSPMIRNYLGFPAGVSGAELLRRAWLQASMFGANMRIGRAAREIRVDGHQMVVALDDGTEATTGAVVLATGVAYRRIGIPSVEALVGRGVFYGYGATEAQALTGEPVAVVGGGNSAAQAAVHAARYARTVHLLVRGETLDGVSEYLREQLGALANVELILNTEIVEARDRQQLRSLLVRNRLDGSVTEHKAAGLFILIGAAPRTEWLPATIARDKKGYLLTGDRAPLAAGVDGRRQPLETTMSGVFAAGDVRAGSVKRVAAAVGEGASAVQQLLSYRSAAAA